MSTLTVESELLELAFIFDHGLSNRAVLEEAFYTADLTELTLMSRNGVFYAVTSWNPSSEDATALNALVRKITDAHPSIRIQSVEPSNMVTSAEIARRLNRSRQSVQLWISGARGSGNFPVPVAGMTSKTLIWNWIEVLNWIKSENLQSVESHLKLAKWVGNFSRHYSKM